MTTAPAGILDHHPSTRLAVLEAANIVTHFKTEAAWFQTAANCLLAGVENRLIEYLLVRRLRSGLKADTSEAEAKFLMEKFRGAYASGQMETFLSFLPAPSEQALLSEPASFDIANSPQMRPRILYIPGGGFIFPTSKRQKTMMARLAQQTGCEVVPGIHSLAPENPFPTAPNEIAVLYRSLVEDDEQRPILLGADTAGASVVLGALQILLNEGMEVAPKGIILFSPWCDLSLSSWSYITKSVTAESPFRMETAAFCARLYLGTSAATDPLASAVFAEPNDWPPMLIHTMTCSPETSSIFG